MTLDVDENELTNTPKSNEQLKNQIEYASIEFINTLQSSSLPSSTVQKILTHTRELIGEVLGTVEETAAPISEDIENKVPPSEEKVQLFKSIISVVKDPFESFDLTTCSQRNQHCSQAGTLVKPREIVLGNVFRANINKETGRTEQQEVKETFQYIPIGENLKLFLSRPGCMKCITQEKRRAPEDGFLLETVHGWANY